MDIDLKEAFYKALGIFVKAMNQSIINRLKSRHGDKWFKRYFKNLSFTQQEEWKLRIKYGLNPKKVINISFIKDFVLENKEIFTNTLKKRAKKKLIETLPSTWENPQVRKKGMRAAHFKKNFKQDIGKLPMLLEEIYDVWSENRCKCQLEDQDYERALESMLIIAWKLRMTRQVKNILKLLTDMDFL